MGLTSIIILVHNQLDLTQSALISIERYTPERYEIILVDNGSDQETQQWLRRYAKDHPGSKLIVNNRNRGFAGGNNLGLAVAEGDYVLLLNNDVIVTPGWLTNMHKALESSATLGYAGPLSNRVAGTQLVPASYTTADEMLAFAEQLCGENAGKTVRENRLIGFCLLLKREVVDKIGALDSGFGTGNFEDDDYCLRAYYAGYEGVIACDSFVHHEGSKTFAGMGIDYQAKMNVNRRIFHNKWQLESAQGGYLWPTSPNGVGADRYFISIPVLATTHRQDEDGVWLDQDTSPVPVLEMVFRAVWSIDSLETATASAICDAFDGAGRLVARVSTGAVSSPVPTLSLTPKPQLNGGSDGPLALLMLEAAQLNARDAAEIVRRADRVYAPNVEIRAQLVAAGVAADLIELLSFGPDFSVEETVAAIDRALVELGELTPVAQLQPLHVDERKQTLLALTATPTDDADWQAVLAYAQAFDVDDDVTLAIPCTDGQEDEVTETLLALLERHQVDTDSIADVLVLATDADTTALQLAADAIIKTTAPAAHARQLLTADQAALRAFAARR